MADKLIEINHLKTSFRIGDDYYAAVDDVSLSLNKNEVLAIVGESGCGKSALAFSIMGLHNRAKIEGEILYRNYNLVDVDESTWSKLRGKNLGMIFQDPLTALNPLMTVGAQISEALFLHNRKLSNEERKAKVIELIEKVGIPRPEHVYMQYPHELSGGMRQRVVIAIAIANDPEVLIADEPTTALDATIQSQILDLIRELKESMNAGIVLITHDLGVVAEMADRVAVMYAGQIVEIVDVHRLFENPLHPYTRSLLNSIPNAEKGQEKLHVIQGIVPALQNLPREGCRFKDRIPWIDESAHETTPELHEVAPGHFVRCTCYKQFHFPNEMKEGQAHANS
ncbi:peptide/nickel transport system ATP-binding protein [Cerasibacillus quisquiliarum]|uniref:Dipeptide/oligopeptide/nickel ABC transporter ATP-binding protein n=1 Tax=Cerasibacillus quisquiliarum TaxID=227865 RepID=A0A511V3H4_9BACI|nr:ABC transporter ATP-binding protein [Cerasibacillus quisquiliarum]MBB5147408.1 peptide/nickel transport system ATP-binding protein [Cerasibacillus quisquiliarum]GEN32468.1 dipeptide/oligopeptide/nickel ABC transporter ATP-binding protein [Cerasibacillus quisquiliarum]